MSSLFVAVPVGKGDAFYFEHDEHRVLVDGGLAVDGFSESFCAATGTDELDVVVCTHADADHANGILGLLRVGAVAVREVWLPGRWTERLTDLCSSPLKFYEELASQCCGDKPQTLEEREISDSVGKADGDEEEADLAEDQDWSSLEDAAADTTPSRFCINPWQLPWAFIQVTLDGPSPAGRRLFEEAIETAERIRAIAHWAVHRGCHIRWFDYARFRQLHAKPGGGTSLLKPLNAVELVRPPRRRRLLSALDYLTLSVSNTESLVFLAEAPADSLDVVFSADSDFAFPLPAAHLHRLIATAPHHGSAENAAVYGKVTGWHGSDDLRWVRSDCRTRTRPCLEYKQAQGPRFCTLCNAGGRPKMAVSLAAGASGWLTASAFCTCQ
jgi:hypothetical protein